MALEELKAQIALLMEEMINQPQDQHEIQEQLREKLSEMRAMGMPIPEDLADLEAELAEEFAVEGEGAEADDVTPA